MAERNGVGADEAAEFYDRRRTWIDELCENPNVKHATFRVGYWMARRMNAKDGGMWWPIKKMVLKLKMDRKTVFSAVSELESLGLLIVVREPGKASWYSIRLQNEDFRN